MATGSDNNKRNPILPLNFLDGNAHKNELKWILFFQIKVAIVLVQSEGGVRLWEKTLFKLGCSRKPCSSAFLIQR